MDKPDKQSGASADASEKLFAETRPSILKIETDKGTGTGWLINDNTVVTSYHVIANARKLTAIAQDGNRYLLGAEVVFDPLHDVAILKFQGNRPSFLKPLATGSSVQLRTGEDLAALGHGNGGPLKIYRGQFELNAKWRDWLVLQEQNATNERSRLRAADFQKYLSQEVLNRPLVKARMDTVSGCSGGPIINKDGKVTAIVTQGVTGVDDLGFHTPVEKLHDLMRDPDKFEKRSGYYELGLVTHMKKIENNPVSYVLETGTLLGGAWGASHLVSFSQDPMSLISRRAALRYSLIGAGALGALSFYDFDGLSRSTNDRDTLKYGLSLSSDLTMASGFAAKYMSVLRSTGVDRAGKIGKTLMLAGAGARLACELIPNSFVVDIGRQQVPGQ